MSRLTDIYAAAYRLPPPAAAVEFQRREAEYRRAGDHVAAGDAERAAAQCIQAAREAETSRLLREAGMHAEADRYDRRLANR